MCSAPVLSRTADVLWFLFLLLLCLAATSLMAFDHFGVVRPIQVLMDGNTKTKPDTAAEADAMEAGTKATLGH